MMQIDLQCTFLVGSAMAFASRNRLRTASDGWIAKTRNVVQIFGGIIFAPIWLYITLAWTEWETMYIWDMSTIPLWFIAGFLPFLSLTALLGFYLTQRGIREKKLWLVFLPNIVVAGSVAAIVIQGWNKATFVGSLEQFQAGPTANILQSWLALFLLAGVFIVFIPAGVIIWKWLKSSDTD